MLMAAGKRRPTESGNLRCVEHLSVGNRNVTNEPELFSCLAAPFGIGEVKTRTGTGTKFDYVTARTVMNRLDSVLGPENWWDSYRAAGGTATICSLTIRLPDGKTVTKEDVGGSAGMADGGDDEKSSVSDAFKRAAVKFGVSRYLYKDGVPDFAADKFTSAQGPSKPTPSQPHPAGVSARPSRQGGYDNFKLPSPGRAVFAWAKAMESHYSTSLIDGMKAAGTNAGYGTNFVEWDQAQAEHVCRGVVEYIKSLDSYSGEWDGVAATTKTEPPASDGALKVAREQIVIAVKAILAKQGNPAPIREDIKEVIGELSAASPNKHGLKGEECVTLAAVVDMVWLTNIHKNALEYLKQISSTAAAVDDQGEDDIPF